MVISGIYKICNSINDKIYVGSAANLTTRINCHLHDLKHNKHANTHLQNAFNKYGESAFQFEVIERCEKDQLIEREQHYIDSLKPSYNICRIAGSSLGVKPSEEKKKKISDSIKKFRKENPNWRSGRNHPLFGKNPHNKGKKGEVQLLQNRRKVVQINTDLEVVRIFQRSIDVEEQFKSRCLIRRCCQGKQPIYSGYYWMYEDEYNDVEFRNKFLADCISNAVGFLIHPRKRKKSWL